MKQLGFLFLFLIGYTGFSQSFKTIVIQENGVDIPVEMIYEEKGELSLLSYRTGREVFYYLEKGEELTLLTPENYKEILMQKAANVDLDIMKLKYNLRDLSKIVRKYNGGDNDYYEPSGIAMRLGVLGGLGNFTEYTELQNPGNTNIPFFGIESEVYSKTQYLRHSGFAQLRQSFGNDDFDLTQTEFVLGYRFKLIDTDWFHFYAESELVSLFNYNLTYIDDTEEIFDLPTQVTDKGFQLGTPFTLGFGMAIKIFKETFLTFNYSNLVRLGEDTRSDTPIDVRFGVKFKIL